MRPQTSRWARQTPYPIARGTHEHRQKTLRDIADRCCPVVDQFHLRLGPEPADARRNAQHAGAARTSVADAGAQPLGPTQFAASKIYQSLLTYGPDLKPLPSLAQSWTISPDGLT